MTSFIWEAPSCTPSPQLWELSFPSVLREMTLSFVRFWGNLEFLILSAAGQNASSQFRDYSPVWIKHCKTRRWDDSWGDGQLAALLCAEQEWQPGPRCSPRANPARHPPIGGCYTWPCSQPQPTWHPAPRSDAMPKALGQETSELQLAEGWGGRNLGLLHAHPIPTLLPRPRGGPHPAGHDPWLSPAAPATFRKTQKRASQSKLSLLPSARVSQALLTKITFGFLESRCAKPYGTLLPPARLLALVWVWAVLLVHIWSATHSLWFLLIE